MRTIILLKKQRSSGIKPMVPVKKGRCQETPAFLLPYDGVYVETPGAWLNWVIFSTKYSMSNGLAI
jgi:hypothetical protein